MTAAEELVDRLENFVRAVVDEKAPGADVHEAVALSNERSRLILFLDSIEAIQ
jgi:hypothetical protein